MSLFQRFRGKWRLNCEVRGESDQGGKRVGFHLSHDVCAMDLNSVLGNPQFKSDLLVQQTPNQERQYLALAGRQSLISSVKPLLFDRLPAVVAVSLECPSNRLEEGRIVDRFG